MPAVMTHYLFGEQTLDAVVDCLEAYFPPSGPRSASGSVDVGSHMDGESAYRQDLRQAYLVGCQGPDPLFFSIVGTHGISAHGVGTGMHRMRMSAALAGLRDAVPRLHRENRPIGLAFCAGQLAHYLLDRTAHPFIYAQQYELCASPELADAPHEVHALVESDIDAAMLRLTHDATVKTISPIMATEASERVRLDAGILMTYMGREVYRRDIRPTDYGHALTVMRLCYRLIEPAGSADAHRLGALERVFRNHSELEALAHRVDLGVRTPSMNPDRHEWTNPFTGESSRASFVDLFEVAMAEFREDLPAYLSGIDSLTTARAITGGIDYSGRHLDAQENPAPRKSRRAAQGVRPCP